MIDIRPATGGDEAALWQMLYYASHSDHEEGGSLEGVKANPGLARYVAGWALPSDFGFIARAGAGERDAVVGAAWARLFPDSDRSYGWVDADTPEIVIALAPEGRARGTGTRLLERLIEEARVRRRCLSLSVRSDNPAARLYERLGFQTVAQVTNRVGGLSITMLLRLS